MDSAFGLAAAAAVGIFVGMMIMWPFLKRTAGTEKAKRDRWKMLWQGGLICWIAAVVLTQAIGYMRSQVQEIEQKNAAAVQQHKQRSEV
ncbi:hypothetical protein ACYSUW_14705 [Pseudomonas frederiksbergensis]